MIQFDPAATVIAGTGFGLLVTGLLLGFRHGFDWDHIAAITDITSTTATADAGTEIHERAHELTPHEHLHGGRSEASVHGESGRRRGRGDGGACALARARPRPAAPRDPARDAVRPGPRAVVALLGLGRPRVRRAPAGLGRPDHGPDRRRDAPGPRPLGLLLALPVRPPRDRIPASQPLDARLRRWSLRLAASAGAAPRPRARRSDRDELVRPEDRVRRRHDPRHRRRDRQPGPASSRPSAVPRARASASR